MLYQKQTFKPDLKSREVGLDLKSRGLIIQDLIYEEQDFKIDFGFNREPMKGSEYGVRCALSF